MFYPRPQGGGQAPYGCVQPRLEEAAHRCKTKEEVEVSEIRKTKKKSGGLAAARLQEHH